MTSLRISERVIYKVFFFVLVAALTVAFMQIAHIGKASADGYTWMSGTLTGTKADNPDPYVKYGACTIQTVKMEISIWSGFQDQQVCLFQAKSYRYAINSDGILYISVGNDKNMYPVQNLGFASYSYVHPSPETDDYMFSGVVVKDMLSKLTLDDSTSRRSYIPDDDLYYNLATDDQGDVGHSIYDSAVSHNGQWQVVVVRGLGLVRFHMTDMTATWFASNTNQGQFMAISNDGKYVARTSIGSNSQPVMYDLEGCGQSASILQSSWFGSSLSNPCTSRELSSSINTVLGVAGSNASEPPDFSDDNGQLTVYVYVDGASKETKVTLYAAGYYEPQQLDYLALGDSISSGEGDIEKNAATDKKYYRNYTDVEEDKDSNRPREKCHLSTRSYPYHLAASMNLSSDRWDSVACSGAKSTDIYQSGNDLYAGQSKGAGNIFSKDGDTPRLQAYGNRESLQTTALNLIIPGRIEQVDFVKTYKPKVVTLTGGANDIDFSGKLKTCISQIPFPNTCEWASSNKSILATQIQNEYDKLSVVYKKIHEAAGEQSRIYVVGYPQIISDNQPGQCKGNVGSLDLSERQMIVDTTNYLNEVIEHAANAAGVKYLDISHALDGHKLCEGDNSDMNGLLDFLGVIDSNNTALEMQESYHPNMTGQTHIALAIERAVNYQDMKTYDVCPGTIDSNDTLCPNVGSSATKPPITDFDGVQPVDPVVTSENKKVMDSVVKKNSEATITLDKYSGRPSSTKTLSIHSDPVDLGSFTVASDGSLNQTITIPSTVPAGYHTLIITGESYSGEPSEITQTILVTGENSNDLDDNGTPDSQQPCGPFLPSSGQDIDLDGIDDACDPQISDSPPQLYRVRQGDNTRDYGSSPEHEDYLYIERNTHASAITGITNDYDPDGDGWAIVGASRGTPFNASSVPDTAPAANFIVSGEGVNAKPYVYLRADGYGCTSFTPKSLARVKVGHVRTLKVAARNTDKCRQEDPSYDVDGDGLPDNIQPLYAARNGDATKGEDPARIYLYRNFYAAEAQLGISDYSPTGTSAGNPDQPIQAWNLLASSKPNISIPAFNKLVILQDGNGKPMPTILTKKLNGQCIAYQPGNTNIIKMTTQSTRYLKKLTSLPEGVSCE